MKNLSYVANNLFNKIRGRFSDVTIGDEDGTVTNIPEEARYFDFSYMIDGVDLGKVSVNISEDTGLTVIMSQDFASGQTDDIQNNWYSFLKELRLFAKKNMMNFDVRDINKNNLTKRDYSFLANKTSGDEPMAESKMYGTNKTSYQRIGNARLAIKHIAPINVESATGRTQKINAIYIESPTGERFKYPYKHLSGARAMAMPTVLLPLTEVASRFLISVINFVNRDVTRLSEAVISNGLKVFLTNFPELADEPNSAPFSRVLINAGSLAIRVPSIDVFIFAKCPSFDL